MSDERDTADVSWVQDSLNANTQVGKAARIISRWGQDWHREFRDPKTYDSAYNDILDLRDTITTLLAERDALKQELAGMQEERRQSGKDWLALVRAIAAINDTDEWALADDATLLEQFDPWQALRELAQAEQWQPVQDGTYNDLIGRHAYIEDGGKRFGMNVPDYDCSTGEWFETPCYADMYDCRLCRRVPSVEVQSGE